MKGKKLITIISIVFILAVMLCVPAFATVTESDGNGYALYNGVKLINIDTVWVDKATYSYSIIVDIVDGDGFILSLSTEKWERIDVAGSSYKQTFTDGSVVSYQIVSTSTSWELAYFEYSAFDDEYTSVVWVNEPLYDVSDEVFYMSSSTPISLDGYSIIEWDGDTTGLTKVEYEYYKLASYEYADYAFAVWNGDTRSFQASYVSESPLWVVQSSGATGLADGTAIAGGNDGTDMGGLSFDGIVAHKVADYYTSLIAYRTTETPPDEGSGDDPDDPQPPLGG